MSIETDNNFFFTGSDKGIISLYDYNDSDPKRKFTLKNKLDLYAGIKVTNVKYKNSKSEVITGFSNGSVAFWTHFEHEPEFVLDCHEKKVTNIQYEEEMKLLITASTDKTLKVTYKNDLNLF
jgi:WD40 repeat protein